MRSEKSQASNRRESEDDRIKMV